MAAQPRSFSGRPSRNLNQVEEFPSEVLLTLRRRLQTNNRWCEQTRWELQSFYTKFVGGKPAAQMLLMLEELLTLGEAVACDLYEAPSYHQRLEACAVQQSQEETNLYREFLDRGIVLTAIPQPSAGTLRQKNAVEVHTCVNDIGAKARAYNQKLRQVENWRHGGRFRPMRMWIADVPSCRYSLTPLPLVS